ncbi:hypothetical protein C0V97_15935 [Asaia sp. W19]|uniref:Hint domain-containing protein n=1 Tax=unclassified Asaia TaxID=2685023 RepID=UPI001002BA92|nr:Hint domain-containing protein [Asaia sp. W19]RUT24563.1 hypothetical protein C0V97_15935 [Asaia sp. W19]
MVDALKQPETEECWLVRICKDALGHNVPARMLLNHQSIYLDRSQTQYRYFHVELDEHEAIWAGAR